MRHQVEHLAAVAVGHWVQQAEVDSQRQDTQLAEFGAGLVHQV